MDRRRSRTAVLGLGLALAAGLAVAAAPQIGPPLKGLRWLAPGADPVARLTRAPTECLTLPAAPAARLSVEIGRAAFRTPVVLGGQAARSGVACETCHQSGRTNPEFHFPGVSGPPGTADVTSSLFSTHRDNGVFDPRPIPDLSGPKARLKISQAPGDPALAAFIQGLVTQEFDGPQPPPAVLQGLADYVRALSPEACPAQADRPVDVAGLMEDARRAATAAQALADAGDRPAALVMIAGARARLGLIDERFAAPDLARQRRALMAADRRLATIAETLRGNAPPPLTALAAWRRDSLRLEADLTRQSGRSLFDPPHLAATLQVRLPRQAS
ncbi:hypothetical protein [Phenylobacterium aquaticum]|uniref:hypothetical protein n=1 Tax=Phenylobacterium aquaticum TaxID=1763816 RepID=UPI001F5DE779|nr:hypothetical protein [Phenylobacterium aquaticum]MCI3131170.1 hypothetical protein [Phenylobacterium aquaticum]